MLASTKKSVLYPTQSSLLSPPYSLKQSADLPGLHWSPRGPLNPKVSSASGKVIHSSITLFTWQFQWGVRSCTLFPRRKHSGKVRCCLGRSNPWHLRCWRSCSWYPLHRGAIWWDLMRFRWRFWHSSSFHPSRHPSASTRWVSWTDSLRNQSGILFQHLSEVHRKEASLIWGIFQCVQCTSHTWFVQAIWMRESSPPRKGRVLAHQRVAPAWCFIGMHCRVSYPSRQRCDHHT